MGCDFTCKQFVKALPEEAGRESGRRVGGGRFEGVIHLARSRHQADPDGIPEREVHLRLPAPFRRESWASALLRVRRSLLSSLRGRRLPGTWLSVLMGNAIPVARGRPTEESSWCCQCEKITRKLAWALGEHTKGFGGSGWSADRAHWSPPLVRPRHAPFSHRARSDLSWLRQDGGRSQFLRKTLLKKS